MVKNRRHPWIGRIIRHTEFAVNILEGEISGKKAEWKTSTTILKASRQKHRSWQLYSNEKNGLQQLQVENYQPIKRFKHKTRIGRKNITATSWSNVTQRGCVSTNNCAGIVRCSCYRFEINRVTNSKWQFLHCATIVFRELYALLDTQFDMLTRTCFGTKVQLSGSRGTGM